MPAPKLTRRLLPTLVAALVGLMSFASLTALASTIGGTRSANNESIVSFSDAIESTPTEFECFIFTQGGWSADAPDPLLSVADANLGYSPTELKYRDDQPERREIHRSCYESGEPMKHLGDWSGGIIAPLAGKMSLWVCKFTERPSAICFVELSPVEFATTVTDEQGCTQSFNSWGYQILTDCTMYLMRLYEQSRDEIAQQQADGFSCQFFTQDGQFPTFDEWANGVPGLGPNDPTLTCELPPFT